MRASVFVETGPYLRRPRCLRNSSLYLELFTLIVLSTKLLANTRNNFTTMAAAADVQSVPSFMRTVPGSINIPVAKFPSPPKSVSISIKPQEVAANVVKSFNRALLRNDYSTLSTLFQEDGYWRDHLALSWKFRTVQGPDSILNFLTNCAGSKDGFRLKEITVDDSLEVRSPKVLPIDSSGHVLGVQFFFTLKTALGTGQGLCRLAEDHGQWKIFTFYTRIQELTGYEESINHRRPKGAEHGGQPGRKNWAERRAVASNFEGESEPTVLIIGKLKAR